MWSIEVELETGSTNCNKEMTYAIVIINDIRVFII